MTGLFEDDYTDYGREIQKKIIKKLKHIDLKNEAEAPLRESYNGISLELPEMPEEIISLRGKRHKIYIISGIETTAEEKYVSFVALALPFMGWELHKFCNTECPGEKRPEWVLELQNQYYYYNEYFDPDYWYYDLQKETDLGNPMRMFQPVHSVYVEEQLDDEGQYLQRKKVLLAMLELLCGEFGFLIYSTESGNLSKDIKDEFIHPRVLKLYDERLAGLDRKLKDDPDDPLALYQKAGLMLSRDHTEEALDFIKMSLKSDPELPQSWYLLADVYTRMGDDEKAELMENKAKELQKHKQPNYTLADVYEISSVYNPLIGQVSGPNPEADADEDWLDICYICDYDFLFIKDGIWYVCNGCDREGFIEGASLDIQLEIEKDEYLSSETEHIEICVKLQNTTKYELECTMEHDGMEFLISGEYSKKSSGSLFGPGRKKSIDTTSRVLAPGKPRILKPGVKDEFKLKLKDLEGGEGPASIFKRAGAYEIFLWMKVKVFTDWGEIESASESNDILFNII